MVPFEDDLEQCFCWVSPLGYSDILIKWQEASNMQEIFHLRDKSAHQSSKWKC